MTARLLTADDVAERLGCSRSYAYEVMKEMPCLKKGRMRRTTERALANWIARNTTVENPCLAKNDSIGEGERGGAGTTTPAGSGAGNPSTLRIVKSPEADCDAKSAKPRIRPIQPRTANRKP